MLIAPTEIFPMQNSILTKRKMVYVEALLKATNHLEAVRRKFQIKHVMMFSHTCTQAKSNLCLKHPEAD